MAGCNNVTITAISARVFLRRLLVWIAMAGLAPLVVTESVHTLSSRPPVAVTDVRLAPPLQGSPADAFSTLEILPLNLLLGGTASGVHVLDRETGLWSEHTTKSTGGRLPSDDIRQIAPWREERKVFYRTAAGGLAESDWMFGRWRTLYSVETCGIPDKDVSVVAPVDERWLAVGSSNHGLCVYDTETRGWRSYTTSNGLASNTVNDLLCVKGSEEWTLLIATSQGLNHLALRRSVGNMPTEAAKADNENPQARSIVAFEPSLSAQPKGSENDAAAFRTSANGVGYRKGTEAWSTLVGDRGFPAAAAPQISAVQFDRESHLMIVGTLAEGWDVYDTRTHDWLQVKPRKEAVRDIIKFKGRWWIAVGEGIEFYDPSSRATGNIHSGARVQRLLTDGDRVFALSDEGLQVFDANPAKPELLIPAAGTPVETLRVVEAFGFDGELWLAMEDASILRYSEKTHRIVVQSMFQESPKKKRTLKAAATSEKVVWAVISEKSADPGVLHLDVAGIWRPVAGVTDSVLEIHAVKTGILARTTKGGFFYVAEDGGVVELFAGTGPDLLSTTGHVVVRSSDGLDLYVAVSSPSGGSELYRYHLPHHAWFAIEVPGRVRIEELHEREGNLFAITAQGGLLQRSGSSWRTIRGTRGVLPEDGNVSDMTGAVQTGSHLWVAFRSGHVYTYSLQDHDWESQGAASVPLDRAGGGSVRFVEAADATAWMLQARDGATPTQVFALSERGARRVGHPVTDGVIEQAVVLKNGDLLGQMRDGSALRFSALSEQGVPVFKGSFGGAIDPLVLAIPDREEHRQWIVTRRGSLGVYNLKSHAWDFVDQVSEGELRPRYWGIAGSGSNRFIWFAVDSGTYLYRGGQKTFIPDWVLFQTSTDGAVALAYTGNRVSGTSVIRIDGGAPETIAKIPAAFGGTVRGVATNLSREAFGTNAVFVGTDAGLVYVIRNGGLVLVDRWELGLRNLISMAALPLEWARNPSGSRWMPGMALVLDVLSAIGIGLLCHYVRRQFRSRRENIGILVGCLVFLGFAASGLFAASRIPIVGTAQPEALEWEVTAEGQPLFRDGKLRLTEKGRFIFDTVDDVATAANSVLLKTRDGVWSLPDPPDSKVAIRGVTMEGAAFDNSRQSWPDRTETYPGMLVSDGVWVWCRMSPVLVRVALRACENPVGRTMTQGRWADDIVYSMLMPDAGDSLFFSTPAGVLKSVVKAPESWTFSDTATLAAFRKAVPPGNRREERAFGPSREVWSGPAAYPLTIFHQGPLDGKFSERIHVSLGGVDVTTPPVAARRRFAFDEIQEFSMGGASSSALWVRTTSGVQKYSLGPTGDLSLEESSPARNAAALPSGTPMRVDYAGMTWTREGNRFEGRYLDERKAYPVRITEGRFDHDRIRDGTFAEGRLRLATDCGVWDYSYMPGKGLHLESRSLSVNVERFHDKTSLTFDGVEWRLAGTTGPSPQLLETFSRGQARPIGWRVSAGSQKFDFDVVSNIRFDSGLLAETPLGTLRLDHGAMRISAAAMFPKRPRSIACFDLRHPGWSWRSQTGPESAALIYKSCASDPVRFVEGKFPWDHVLDVQFADGYAHIQTEAGRFVLKESASKPEFLDDANPSIAPREAAPSPACPDPADRGVAERSDGNGTWVVCAKQLFSMRR